MGNVYIKTFGCAANQAESEMMAGMLEESGNHTFYDEKNIENADTILINVCTVKGDKKALREISSLKELYPDKKIVIGGCVTKSMIPKIEKIDPNVSIMNTDNIKSVVEIVESKNPLRILDRKQEIKVRIPRIRSRNSISIIPICQGCTSFCTYCSTKLSKGSIFSYPIEKIIAEAEESIKDGCKEIWLTSQDNGDYGFEWDKKSHLPELIKKIAEIEGDFMIRIGMTNPIGVMSVLDELVESFKSEKVFKFLHVPVQAGNNDVLRRMARRYKVEDFKLLVEKFRKAIPDITISTDIICGFPGETDEQFNDTLKLVEEIQPEVVNISRFVARENTAAFKMDAQIHGNKKKDRSTALSEAFKKNAHERNNRWIGWEGDVVVDEIGKRGELIARNFAYKPVIINEKQNNIEGLKPGDKLKVKIFDATPLDLRGEIIK